MTEQMGPYESQRDTHQAPLLRDIAAVPPGPGAYPPIIQRHLIAACREVGLTLGSYDARVLDGLARSGPEAAQAVIGLIARAHAAGLARRGCAGGQWCRCPQPTPCRPDQLTGSARG